MPGNQVAVGIRTKTDALWNENDGFILKLMSFILKPDELILEMMGCVGLDL